MLPGSHLQFLKQSKPKSNWQNTAELWDGTMGRDLDSQPLAYPAPPSFLAKSRPRKARAIRAPSAKEAACTTYDSPGPANLLRCTAAKKLVGAGRIFCMLSAVWVYSKASPLKLNVAYAVALQAILG